MIAVDVGIGTVVEITLSAVLMPDGPAVTMGVIAVDVGRGTVVEITLGAVLMPDGPAVTMGVIAVDVGKPAMMEKDDLAMQRTSTKINTGEQMRLASEKRSSSLSAAR